MFKGHAMFKNYHLKIHITSTSISLSLWTCWWSYSISLFASSQAAPSPTTRGVGTVPLRKPRSCCKDKHYSLADIKRGHLTTTILNWLHSHSRPPPHIQSTNSLLPTVLMGGRVLRKRKYRWNSPLVRRFCGPRLTSGQYSSSSHRLEFSRRPVRCFDKRMKR